MSMHAEKVDGHIAALMHERKIAGLSLAIIQGGKIVKEMSYGFADKNNKSPVTSATLFKAGSVSKCVAALGALHLVEQGQLSLDADINTRLQTWKLPDNEFTKDKGVTLQHILSHCAGVNVHGFPGYAVDAPCPTQLEVLDGTKPANTPAIRVDAVPGNQPRYSGGGYTVMQQMMIDVTGKPLGMRIIQSKSPKPPLARSVPLSRLTSCGGGGPAFFVGSIRAFDL